MIDSIDVSGGRIPKAIINTTASFQKSQFLGHLATLRLLIRLRNQWTRESDSQRNQLQRAHSITSTITLSMHGLHIFAVYIGKTQIAIQVGAYWQRQLIPWRRRGPRCTTFIAELTITTRSFSSTGKNVSSKLLDWCVPFTTCSQAVTWSTSSMQNLQGM